MKKLPPYPSNEIKGATSTGTWGPNNIPIFSVHTMHEFNQLVGYVKYMNASNGTVLYRGQPRDYGGLKPSGNRGKGCVDNSVIRALAEDKNFRHYLGLDNPEISGWKKYQEILISAVLQHYGANTNCMDFVDNHWCALWFGLHQFNSDTCRYSKSDEKDLYIYLYLADTNCPSIHGTYIGEDLYTVDLRKALPSYFLRPASQHGWVVCGNGLEKCEDYADNILCVIRISVDNASEWLGQGKLLSMENFFPDYDIDDGYKVLLMRQKRSGVYRRNSAPILPVGTIQNYHLEKSFYSSNIENFNISPIQDAFVYKTGSDRIDIKTISELYKILLEKGWSKETCFDAEWDESNPCIGQSPVTAMLVQEIFGGEIIRYAWKKKVHYFNRINGKNYDLTSHERYDHPFTDYDSTSGMGISKKHGDVLREKRNVLMKNAEIVVRERAEG